MSWDPKRGGHYCNKCDGQVTVDPHDQRNFYGSFVALGRCPPPGTPDTLKESGLLFCERCTASAYEALRAFCADLPIVLAERAELAARKQATVDEKRGRELVDKMIALIGSPECEWPLGYPGSRMRVLDTLRRARELLG